MKRNKKQEAAELSVSKIKVRRFEIILTSLFFSALILVMIANIVLYMKNDSQEAINNTYNPRQEL
ncbi:MAG: hypothetical protein K6E18_01635, partial [Lachnospiraceae bacterium]|nr:hypothetical protein [Lachnospiraceae bacterium]